MHEPAGELQCAVEACAPELAFARVALKEVSPEWGAPSDVWAVGSTVRLHCTHTGACVLKTRLQIYEIIVGSSLFYGMGIADGLLNTMVKLTGAVPPAWQSYWQSRPYLQGTGPLCLSSISCSAADMKPQKSPHMLLQKSGNAGVQACEQDARTKRMRTSSCSCCGGCWFWTRRRGRPSMRCWRIRGSKTRSDTEVRL